VSDLFLTQQHFFILSVLHFVKTQLRANQIFSLDFSLIPTRDLLPKLLMVPRTTTRQKDDSEQIVETMVAVEGRKRRRARTRTANLERGTMLSDYAILEQTRRSFLRRSVVLARSATAVTTSENISRRASGKI